MGKVLFSEPIYVFSDSKRVVGICVAKGYHRILGGKIGHVSFADSESSEDKTMLDYFFYNVKKRESLCGFTSSHVWKCVLSICGSGWRC